MIDKFWNGKIAHHPLNWLIVVVVMIFACILLDSFLTWAGLDKPVTRSNQRAVAGAPDNAPDQPAAPT